MRNLKMTIAYEGTRFLGWQKTKMGPSIEEELENALVQIVRHPVQLQAASRTDAGVHAAGQVTQCFSECELPLARLQKSLNGLLPDDISVRDLAEAGPKFHPTLDCLGKEYHYQLCLGPSQLPFHRRFSWHFPYPLDLQAMIAAAPLLVGRHDFSAFTNEKKNDNVREVHNIAVESLPDHRLLIRVSGHRFLYKMVRNIVGTLVYIGAGKLTDLSRILASGDRTLAGATAPAHGLSLYQVIYAEK